MSDSFTRNALLNHINKEFTLLITGLSTLASYCENYPPVSVYASKKSSNDIALELIPLINPAFL